MGMSLFIDKKNKFVELLLDTDIATVSEWIPGEGGDISLIRCRETNRVVGVHLPLIHEELKVVYNDRSQENKTHPYIWGDGWYAIRDDKHDCWWLAPIKFFDKMGHCPDGWEWGIPEGMDPDDLDDFIDEHGCEPKIPKEFYYCMESAISRRKNLSVEEQKQILKDFGFTVDNIPKWKYER